MIDAERWARIKAIFQEALERPPSDRHSFIRQTCGADSALCAEVESLLSAHESAGDFAERPAIESIKAEGRRPLEAVARTLRPGDRFGGNDIVGFISAGGMGEVYRARDPHLGRDVAIKLLPPAFTDHAERLARFEREARVLAALNHPNIGAIYGLVNADGLRGLVLELVEGETLAERIQRGPLSVDDALPIARQIADALEAAHDKGIIHRDLKPGNIKITPDGVVKVLDFGLAKALDDDESAPDAVHDPTVTQGDAGRGVVLGTAAYMSPEQACGKKVDRRTDVWAFGVVLFEILTGRRPFSGETISETLASVLKTDPEWHALPVTLPPHLRRLLRRCLEKDQKRRLQAIGDARIEIDDFLQDDPELSVAVTSPPARRRYPVLAWMAVGAGAIALALAVLARAGWRDTPTPATMRLSVGLGADVSLPSAPAAPAIALSGDGRLLAFVARKGGSGNPQLYLRRLDQLQATALAGTDNAESPFFSPNGQWIAFFSSGKLKKISVAGGLPITLCDAPNGRGGTWADDDTIVFSPSQGRNVHLLRVPAAGGIPTSLISLDDGEVTQRWPQVLPDGTAVLFTSSSSPGDFSEANLVLQPWRGGQRKIIQRGGYHGRYLSSGHLIYIREGKLYAARFDRDRMEIVGQPVVVLEGLASNADTGGAQFAISANGTLVYVPGHSVGSGAQIHWMDRHGQTTPLRTPVVNWSNLRFSPDGHRLAMQIAAPGPSDIWIYEWMRDTMTRLTSDPVFDSKPVWSPDGRRIAFASARADKLTLNLYWQSADGTGSAERLTTSRNEQRPASWHPSGRFLAFEEENPTTSWGLMILPMVGDDASGWRPGKPRTFLDTGAVEREPMFSPDGRWVAYHSNESGHDEVYVRPFAGPGGKWQISSGGGTYPIWSQAGRELFYTVNGQILVVPFAAQGDSFRPEKPRLWSEGRYFDRPGNRGYDVHPDGNRFAVAVPPAAPMRSDAQQAAVAFIFNFSDELQRMVPRTGQ